MRHLLMVLIFLQWWAGPVWAAVDHGISASGGEQRARDKDAHLPYISSGCAPTGFSALEITAFACDGYVKNGQELPFVRQEAVAVTLPAVNGNHYLLLFHDEFTLPAGWSAAGFGSHYRQQQGAAQPADPDGGKLFLKAVVDGGVITDLIDLRNVSAHRQGWYDVMSPPFNGIPGDGTDQFPAIQAAIEAACNGIAVGERGGVVYMGKGIWNIATQLDGAAAEDTCQGLILKGAGMHATRIQAIGAIGAFDYSPASFQEARLVLEDIAIWGNLVSGGDIITVSNATDVVFNRVWVRDTLNDCIVIGPDATTGSMKDVRIEECTVYAISTNGNSNLWDLENVHFGQNVIVGQAHLHIDGSGWWNVESSNFAGNDLVVNGVLIDGTTEFNLSGNFIERYSGTTVLAQTAISSHVHLENNHFQTLSSTTIDFSPGSRGHVDIKITGNRFPANMAGGTLFDPGATDSYRFCDNSTENAPSAHVTGFPVAVDCVTLRAGSSSFNPGTEMINVGTHRFTGTLAVGGDVNASIARSGEELRLNSAAGTGTVSLRPAGATRLTVQSDSRVTWSPLTNNPALCSVGDTYSDTSGAFCICTSTNTWTNTHAIGTCT